METEATLEETIVAEEEEVEEVVVDGTTTEVATTSKEAINKTEAAKVDNTREDISNNSRTQDKLQPRTNPSHLTSHHRRSISHFHKSISTHSIKWTPQPNLNSLETPFSAPSPKDMVTSSHQD